jgi:hypothetical protein
VRWLTAALTHRNGGALEQQWWHVTSDHGVDVVLGHEGEAARHWTAAVEWALSASYTEVRPVGALWHRHGAVGPAWHMASQVEAAR